MSVQVQNPMAVLNLTKVAALLGARALKYEQEKQASMEKAAALGKTVMQTLVQQQLIKPHQEKEAQAALATHEGTLELLHGACQRIHAYSERLEKQAASEMGRAVADPATPAPRPRVVPGNSNSPYCGIKSAEARESDQAFLDKLGVSFPARR